ncbi:MAG TPA: copper chaperone PCu(A)C [Trebonia sp.]|nr:copper chaperone PCu(A)C [Trebonia sp.]
MTVGPRRPPRLSALARAITAAIAVAVATGAAACSRQPDARSSPAPSQVSPTGATGTTEEVDGAIDVVNARIPAPAAGSATAQAEMTLAGTTGPDVLEHAASAAARAITFTSNGKPIPRITIPVADGSSLNTGPPFPDRILLTGLRHPLRLGQDVTITLTFAHAGRATLRVPVTVPVP